jgi:uncharacterized membrane protein YeaQ/YmgE (transglycosylase-associated protein family)
VFGLSTVLGLVVIAAAGLLVGAVAKLLVPGRDPGGILTTCALGIAGSFLGGWIGRDLGVAVGFAISVAGAMLILIGYRVLRRLDPNR